MSGGGGTVAVIGAGRSGCAAVELALHLGHRVVLLDGGSGPALEETGARFEAKGVEVMLGERAEGCGRAVDFVVQSPGIDLRKPIIRQFSEAGVPVIGELEFAARHCEARIVGITGTNGKTTTTELVERVFNHAGMPSVCAGNYGVPLSEVVLGETRYEVISLEVSSFQLEAIETFRPWIGVWMNFAEDHLDRYDGMEDYHAAKMRMFQNQTQDDWIVIQAPHREAVRDLPAGKVTFSAFEEADYTLKEGKIRYRGEAVLDYGGLRLRGAHNAENVMAALAVGQIAGIEADGVFDALAEYRAPEHRFELVRVVEGREFINDSKSTNLHSLESSLRGQPERVILIAGGKDKGLSFAGASAVIGESVAHAVLTGDTAEAMRSAWGGATSCHVADDLGSAVKLALRLASPGQTIIFSPGASSFDRFSSYIERGRVFKEIVDGL